MRKTCWLITATLVLAILATSAQAQTVAYWRFEDGANGDFLTNLGTEDLSGNGNTIYPDAADVWTYSDQTASWVVNNTSELNNLSLYKTSTTLGAGTASYDSLPTYDAETITPMAWTLEATFKKTGAGNRTIVCRNSIGQQTSIARPSLYLSCTATNQATVRFTDLAGNFHIVNSAADLIQVGENAPWYHIAAVSDGATLRLYLAQQGQPFQEVGLLDISASTNPGLSAGVGSELASNNPQGINYVGWHGGQWAIGYSLYNGAKGDGFPGYIDEVRLTEAALPVHKFLGYEKNAAWNPVPADGAVDQPITVEFTWNAPLTTADPSQGVNTRIDHYELFVAKSATDPNLADSPIIVPFTGGDTEMSAPVAFGYDLTYQWRVDTVVNDPDPNTFRGPVWNYTTLASIPVVTTNPTDQLVAPGETATFTVAAASISELTYQWMKVNPDGDDTPVSGATTDTLTFNSVTVDDDGFYYCILNNLSQIPVESAAAALGVKREMAAWTLDANLSDVSTDDLATYDAFYADASDPNIDDASAVYAAGIVNDAIALGVQTDTGVVRGDRFLQVADSADDFEFWTRGFTVSAWVNSSFNTAYQGIVSKQLRTDRNDAGNWITLPRADWRGWIIDLIPSGQVSFGLRQPDVSIEGGTSVNDGQWHFVTATWDAQTRITSLYVDGEQVAQSAQITGTPQTCIRPVVIGDETTAGTIGFAGLIDDVRIYNYARSDIDVARDFTDIAGGNVCVASARPEATFDFDGNCVIDLLDFAQLAQRWLDCGLYPDCVQ